jgi:putative spermidine/putrescine transport system permease protein
MVESIWVRVVLRVATWLVLAFLYLPLLILAIFAFNESRFMVWPPPGFTLHWFGEALTNPAIPRAFMNSVLAALAAVAIALVLGTLAAMAVQRFSFFGRNSINFLMVLPIALPGVVTGIALSTTFQTLGIEFGLMTIIIGHATFCIVIAYNNVVARLRRLPRSPEEASADMGAEPWITFRNITMPGMRTALLSGGLLAFALSFDEVIVTLFTSGAGTQTIPVWILSAMQRPTELPVVNVVALVLILLSTIPVYVAQRISADVGGGGRADPIAASAQVDSAR